MIKGVKKKLENNYSGPIYMPDAACPGPKEVLLNENLAIILLDTHWWVHKQDRRFNKCGIENSEEVLILIEDAIRRHYQKRNVIIAGHHSLKSYGNSDGYFSIKQIILEAPYTIFRKTLGSRKDNHHPDFKSFRNSMLSILEKYPDVIYISAGDSNLQYFVLNNVHHIISGSMTESEFVQSKNIEFATKNNGFAQLQFDTNGNCELIFEGRDNKLFQKSIYNRKFVDKNIETNLVTKLPDSIKVRASSKYDIPKRRQFWLGKNYRDVWNTPIKVPVFDISRRKGGLHVIKRGGGRQTLSLRLADQDGKQYVLRSLDKNLEIYLPNELKNTEVVDFSQDIISTSNPYAAVVVAKLAEYAGVYHTNPEIVYVPHDPNFSLYQEDVARKLLIFD